MEINKQAPAVALKEIVIAAAPETVWAVHTDINSWPSWHGDVRFGSMKRVAAAVGEGSSAIRSVHEFLTPSAQ